MSSSKCRAHQRLLIPPLYESRIFWMAASSFAPASARIVLSGSAMTGSSMAPLPAAASTAWRRASTSSGVGSLRPRRASASLPPAYVGRA